MHDCPLTGIPCDCPILCDPPPWPDLRSQLQAFNVERRILLGGRPINPEGEEILMGSVR